jgi:hypothetical protein
VEDEEHWLFLLGTDLLLDVGLVLLKQGGLELDVSRLVDTVDVSKTGGDGEVGTLSGISHCETEGDQVRLTIGERVL